MVTILLMVAIYLVGGILAIVLLDLFTGRVRERIKIGAYETQSITGGKRRMALIVTALGLWLFWPLAIYAALFQKGDRR